MTEEEGRFFQLIELIDSKKKRRNKIINTLFEAEEDGESRTAWIKEAIKLKKFPLTEPHAKNILEGLEVEEIELQYYK